MSADLCGKEFTNEVFGTEYRNVDRLVQVAADRGCCGVDLSNSGTPIPASSVCEARTEDGSSLNTFVGTPCVFDQDFQPAAPWTIQCQGMSEERCHEADGRMSSDSCSCEFSADFVEGGRQAVLDPIWLCQSAGPFTAKIVRTRQQMCHSLCAGHCRVL